LAGLQVNEDDPNAQHVHDYTDWLSEAQDNEEEEDEPAEPAQ
jgi:hypothetical protein